VTRRASAVLVAGAMACAGAGCGPDPVAIELNFPSDAAFLYAAQARVLVFDVPASDLGACPDLVQGALAGDAGADRTLGPASVCAFRAGDAVLDDVSEGPKAWIAIVEDGTSRAILAGCTIAEAYGGASTIVVHLAQTADYSDVTGSPPACTTVEEKCGGGCGT
jgi:hypothetical protein